MKLRIEKAMNSEILEVIEKVKEFENENKTIFKAMENAISFFFDKIIFRGI